MERGLCKKGFQEGERGRNKERSALEERDRARRRSSRSMKSERRSGGAHFEAREEVVLGTSDTFARRCVSVSKMWGSPGRPQTAC